MNRMELMNEGLSQMEQPDILVIDDDESICEGCKQTLEEEGFRATIARNGIQGLKLVEESHPKIVLVDLKIPGISGQEVLAKITQIDPMIVSIVITGYGSIDTAVETMKIGAFDFLTKPFEMEKLLHSVKRGMKARETREKEFFEKEMPVPVEVAKPETDRQDVLLKGLESLANYYALGLKSHQFYEELRYLETEARYHADRLGQIQQREQAISTIVQHLHVVDEVIVRHQYKKSALIQMLLDIQRQLHWLPRHTLKWLSMRINIPLSRIYTIADFYEAFSLEPQGAHLIQVCEGTACHVRGASEVMDRVSALLNIKPGETDADQVFTLQTVHCLGCCALAPVVKIDNEYYNNPNKNRLKKLFDSYREKKETLCHA